MNVIDPDYLSFASHRLHMMTDNSDCILAQCTGFCYKRNGVIYLVTNGHNVTRVNPETKKVISKSIAFPSRIRTKFREKFEDNPDSNRIGVHSVTHDLRLYTDKDQLTPSWLMHPTHQYNVDVIALPICETRDSNLNDTNFYEINSFNFDEDNPKVSDDVFVLGHPLKSIDDDKSFPIWKRGTIASEPELDILELPRLLIDSATRPGMSGSPVIFQRHGVHRLENGKFVKKSLIGTLRGFLGIYSGRVGNNDFWSPAENKEVNDEIWLSQLGIVWKKKVIDEIIDGKTIGSVEFQSA